VGQQGSSPSNIRYPAWQAEYIAAFLELDPKDLLERVHTAEAAIFKRRLELVQSSDRQDHKAEQQAIEDALSALRVLKRDKLDFPDWEKK
jgi:hypothetical protein